MILRRKSDDERGAVLILVSLLLLAMLIIVSIVLDLSLSRTDRRVNKSTADFAAAAGSAKLGAGGWPAVCDAYTYLLTNAKGYSALDAGSEAWMTGQGVDLASNPCLSTTTAPYTQACVPDLATDDSPVYKAPAARSNRVHWAWFTATAGGGRVVVEIKAGYRLPGEESPSWTDDAGNADPGDSMGCDQIAVIITETRPAGFSAVIDGGSRTTRIRSVARYKDTSFEEDVAALNLLERHDCNVLQTGGSNTRVVALANGDRPGIVQFDSAADGACPPGQPIINGASTSGGPSIVACSTNSALAVCGPPTGPPEPSRISVYALGRPGVPAGNVAPPFGNGTYGDTPVVSSPSRVGRFAADERYRQNVADLDQAAQAAICSNFAANCPSTRTLPQGCGALGTPAAGLCTSGLTVWRVVSGGQCNDPGASFAGATIVEANAFFDCTDLQIGPTGLTIDAADSQVIVTGRLSVGGNLTIVDPRKVWIGGKSSAPGAGGVRISSGASLMVNRGAELNCTDRLDLARDKSTTFVVGKESFRSSGGTVEMCQTFVYLANQFDRVPGTDGTAPCTSVDNAAPCSTTSNYNGLVEILSGSTVKWTAPNELATKPDPADFAVYKFEDLALWTESAGSGGTINEINGQATTEMAGIFFLPNANNFKLAGGGALPVNLNAQFWARKMQVTGGATVTLKPNPADSLTIFSFRSNLVR